MPTTVKHLPTSTKKHLFKLVTDTKYRKAASHASYNLGGSGSPGKPVTKYGWNRLLPAGAGWPDPGKLRLASYQKPPGGGGSLFWYKMEHVGSNSYKFDRIIGFPVCPTCKGTGDILCPECNGTVKTKVGRLEAPCLRCRKGVLICTKCKGKNVANGATVDPDETKW